MRKLSFCFFVALLTATIVIASIITPVYAADSGVIIISKQTVNTGEDVTVTITFNSDDTLKSVNGVFLFDRELFKYKDGGSGLKNGDVEISENIIDSNKQRTYQIVLTAIAPGTATFSFTLEGLKTSGTISKVSQSGSVKVTGNKLEDDETQIFDEKLSITFDEEKYYIINGVETVPEIANFSRSTTKYNNQDINTLTDNFGKYILFYLSNEDGSKTHWFYLTNEEKLEPLEYLISNNNIYIVEQPESKNMVPEGDWKPGKFTIPSTLVTVDCFESTKSIMSDFYVFLCYYDGISQYYRYDKKTEILQRDPEFTLTAITPVVQETPKNVSFMGYLANLSYEAKTLIFLAALEGTLIIVLVILLIKKRRNTNVV